MDALTNSSATISSISMSSPAEAASREARLAARDAFRDLQRDLARDLPSELLLLRERLGSAPLALAVFNLPGEARQCDMLLKALHARMLSCDSLIRLDAASCALLLPGAGAFKAQALMEETLKAAPGLARAVGIAACTGDTSRTAALPQQAEQALQEALKAGTPVRVYRPSAHPLSERKTLVHSDEKRFLFSGGE